MAVGLLLAAAAVGGLVVAGAQGAADIATWHLGPGIGCVGSRPIRTWANGCPAFAQYRVDPAGGQTPWALQVLELRGDRIAGIHAFLDAEEVCARFGVPGHLAAS